MKEITSIEQFNDEMKEPGTVIVKFYAPWCAPCKGLNMIVRREEEALRAKGVRFLNVDVDNENLKDLTAGVRAIPQLTAYDVRPSSTPTVLSIKTGMQSASQLHAWVDGMHL